MKSHLQFLDGLRGYAILMVIIAHSTTHFVLSGSIKAESLSPILLSIFWKGGLGVTLFFLISSFTLTYVYQKGLEPKKFYIKRYFRIAPLYYLGIIIYGFLIYQIKLPQDLLKLISNLFFVHGLSSDWNNSVVPGGWSIGNEFLFYFIFPVLISRLNTLNKLVISFCFSIILAKIALILIHKYLNSDASLLRENFFLFLPTFLIGMISASIVFGKKEKLTKLSIAFLTSIVLAQIVFGFVIYTDTYFSVICAFILVLLAKGSLSFLITKQLVFLGKISYSLYISHFLILHLIDYLNLVSPFENLYVNIIYRVLIILTFAIVISNFTYKYLEQKLVQLGNRVVSKIP